MDSARLADRMPLLYHVAALDAWPAIVRYGLLSASALLDLHGITGERRRVLEDQPRPHSVRLSGPGLPTAILRDQRPLMPLRDEHLSDGLTVADWCRMLNARAYVFTRRPDADRLAGAYPGSTVWVLSARALLDRHRDQVEIAAINTGYALRRPVIRGLGTFVPLAQFVGGRIVEFTVIDGIADVVDLVAGS